MWIIFVLCELIGVILIVWKTGGMYEAGTGSGILEYCVALTSLSILLGGAGKKDNR